MHLGEIVFLYIQLEINCKKGNVNKILLYQIKQAAGLWFQFFFLIPWLVKDKYLGRTW